MSIEFIILLATIYESDEIKFIVNWQLLVTIIIIKVFLCESLSAEFDTQQVVVLCCYSPSVVSSENVFFKWQ